MYYVMTYDERRGWVRFSNVKHDSFTEALIVMNERARLDPNSRFDVAFTPSKRKAKKVKA